MSENENRHRWRGCLFCMTGQEKRVASMIEMMWPSAKAYAVSAAKRRSRSGVKTIDIEVIMPGYVFFEADRGFSPTKPYPDGCIRMLTTADGGWELVGRDDDFAKWVIAHEGVLCLSQAHQVGERIVIHSGPLKDLEGYVQKIDKRNSNGLVQFEVGGNQIRILRFSDCHTESFG